MTQTTALHIQPTQPSATQPIIGGSLISAGYTIRAIADCVTPTTRPTDSTRLVDHIRPLCSGFSADRDIQRSRQPETGAAM